MFLEAAQDYVHFTCNKCGSRMAKCLEKQFEEGQDIAGRVVVSADCAVPYSFISTCAFVVV